MNVPRSRDLVLDVATLWALGWAAWLFTAALSPLPPWKVATGLHAEEAAAQAAATPVQAPVWSIGIGSRWQAAARGRGWSDPEAFLDGGRRRTFAWIEAESAELMLVSPEWPAAQLTVRASALSSIAPLAVDVLLDGSERATLAVPGDWVVLTVPLGPVNAGQHSLVLRPQRRARPHGEARTLSLAVAGVAVGEVAVDDPDRDRGVFAGWVRAGPDERPAVLVSEDATAAPLPAGTARLRVTPELQAFYAFDRGRPVTALGSAALWANGLIAAFLVLGSGLGWSGLLAVRGPARIAVALAASAVVLIAAFAALRLLGRPVTPLALAAALALLGSLPLLHTRSKVRVPWLVAGPALPVLALLAHLATAVVPPLEDQDMEVQGTAHALATRLVPETLTNRGTTIFFAHPPLLHLWVAGSLALSGHLDRIAYYDEAARAARAAPFVEPESGGALAERPHYEAWQVLRRRFLAEPHLWPTRQVNVVLAALAVGLLAHLAASLAGSERVGLALAAVLATFPEFLVRGGYGGYFAASTLLSLLVVALIAEPPTRWGDASAALGSGLAVLADQKGALVPMAWVFSAPRGTGRRRLVPLAGAALGMALFAAYGLALDAPSFLYDFVKEHAARRLALSDVRFAAGGAHPYPSIPALWREFVVHFGPVFTVWAAWASLRAWREERPAARAAAGAVLIGAVTLSLTDWRQTKHLAQVAPLALVAMAASWPRPGIRRTVAWVALASVVAWNVWTFRPLLSDFSALSPTPSW
jgi:hypothetical protein